MTADDASDRVTGRLRAVGGSGVVHLEARVDTGVDDVWQALTDPARLARWLGEVDGDLRPGSELRGHWLASGWEGTVRVEACEPPRRLLVATSSEDEPDGVVEITLTADGGGTVVAFEDRGLPLDHLPDYGAGDQIHVEDLAAHLAGEDRCDARARWAELRPAWEDVPVERA